MIFSWTENLSTTACTLRRPLSALSLPCIVERLSLVFTSRELDVLETEAVSRWEQAVVVVLRQRRTTVSNVSRLLSRS